MSHRPTWNYGQAVKAGVFIGGILLLLGLAGQVLGPRLQGTLPEWELSLFAWISAGGILIAVLSVFIFGVALPLTE